jgi:integrase
MKALTSNEIDKLMDNISDLSLRTAVLVGFRHGLRVSEITGLRRADVDLQAKTITCRRLKNSLTTIQPLAPEEVAALSELLRTSPQSDYVFPSPIVREGAACGKMDRSTFYRHFRIACDLTGIRGKTPHSLKHGLAFALVAANVSLPLIQRALGHRSISSTAVYTMPTDEMAGAAVTAALERKKT